jgi:p-hydroxybenzoate 3-monooxygenase
VRTQVGIVGAGPAGLMLSHLLQLAGVESIVIENRSREYCENRVRAGLMENWVAEMLIDTGVGARLKREAMVPSTARRTSSILSNWSASTSTSTTRRKSSPT